jgi:hypothetical protein
MSSHIQPCVPVPASFKEHELHHRGKLMVVERMLGITPHLTRQREERIAAMQSAQSGR